MTKEAIYKPHISVDSIVFGYDGTKLKVLITEQDARAEIGLFRSKKLPGRVIYKNESIEQAAYAVLQECGFTENVTLNQFRIFGSPDRMQKKEDQCWLEDIREMNVERLFTVAHWGLIKIEPKITLKKVEFDSRWYNVSEIEEMNLAFDHQRIIREGLKQVQIRLESDNYLMFAFLPKKFTISQLRNLHDEIYQIRSDVRNFQKKVMQWSHVVMLDEMETGVAHRAARLYKYDRSGKIIRNNQTSSQLVG